MRVHHRLHHAAMTVALSDLDGDGQPDAVVTDVSVLLVAGGALQAPAGYSARGATQAVAIGDLKRRQAGCDYRRWGDGQGPRRQRRRHTAARGQLPYRLRRASDGRTMASSCLRDSSHYFDGLKIVIGARRETGMFSRAAPLPSQYPFAVRRCGSP